MEKSPAYNYNGGTTGTTGTDTGITGTSTAHHQTPAYADDATTKHNNTNNTNNDYYAHSSAGAGATPTTHPVGTGAGQDHTTRDSMASTAVAPNTTKSRSSNFSGSDVILLVMAIFLPPVAVFLKRGCDAHFFINILLTILAWLPGMIHAFYVVVKYPGDMGDRRGSKY